MIKFQQPVFVIAPQNSDVDTPSNGDVFRVRGLGKREIKVVYRVYSHRLTAAWHKGVIIQAAKAAVKRGWKTIVVIQDYMDDDYPVFYNKAQLNVKGLWPQCHAIYAGFPYSQSHEWEHDGYGNITYNPPKRETGENWYRDWDDFGDFTHE